MELIVMSIEVIIKGAIHIRDIMFAQYQDVPLLNSMEQKNM